MSSSSNLKASVPIAAKISPNVSALTGAATESDSAAASPQYGRRVDVPAEFIERARSIYRSQMEGQNKPAAVIDKIIEGKLGGFYEQVCLLDQPSVRDPKVTIGQLVQQAIAKMGENIAVPRFARFKLGETA